jgi:predicted transcriptional regulator
VLKLEQIKEGFKDINLKAASKTIGISYRTLYAALKSDNPSYTTLKKLSDYLEGKQYERNQ